MDTAAELNEGRGVVPAYVGPYKVLKRIGRGGMGEVFMGQRQGAPDGERPVAVKCIRSDLSGRDPYVRMFLDEARLAHRAAHPNLVSVLDLGMESGSPYLVMELLQGPTLADVMWALHRRELTIPPRLACFIAAQMCEGLSYIHGLRDEDGSPLGAIHRDVCPPNIILDMHSGLTKIFDFGIARVSNDARLEKTDPNQAKGRWGYMAPEQIRSGATADHRADLFSTGVVFWEMLTGQRLFSASNPAEAIRAVMQAQVEAPSTVRAFIPRGIDKLALKALNRDPKKRFQNADSMRKALMAQCPTVDRSSVRDFARHLVRAFRVKTPLPA